jgi:RNA polymerase sigma factor (sigma-70 family)
MEQNKNEYSKLWDLTSTNDTIAYSKLYNSLYPQLYAYTYNNLKNTDLASDIVQDVFIKLWQKRNKIGQIENVKAYFFRVTHSLIQNHFRRENLNRKMLSSLSMEKECISIEDFIIKEESLLKSNKNIKKAIEKLPSRQKEMIYMSFYQNLNYNQIVALTGIKYQSVVNNIYRAVKVLRLEIQSSQNSLAA